MKTTTPFEDVTLNKSLSTPLIEYVRESLSESLAVIVNAFD